MLLLSLESNRSSAATLASACSIHSLDMARHSARVVERGGLSHGLQYRQQFNPALPAEVSLTYLRRVLT